MKNIFYTNYTDFERCVTEMIQFFVYKIDNWKIKF